MQMKLDMAKIKASLRSENDELLKKGFSLPYLENGKTIQKAHDLDWLP